MEVYEVYLLVWVTKQLLKSLNLGNKAKIKNTKPIVHHFHTSIKTSLPNFTIV